MKKPAQHLIAEGPRRQARIEMTIGIDLGDVWSHYCTLNQDGDAVGRGRFRTTPKAIEKWFTDLPPARVAMEAGTHSIWISEQLGHCPVAAEKSAALAPVMEMPVTCSNCWPIFATLTDRVTLVPSRTLPKSSDGGTESTGPVLPLLDPGSVVVSAAETPGN
jgi:hypothetical protein